MMAHHLTVEPGSVYERNIRCSGYGLTAETYNELLAKQGYCCAVCRKSEPTGKTGKLLVDHCHRTGDVRGLLCHKCNLGIGLLGDNLHAVRRAVAYLKNPPAIEYAEAESQEPDVPRDDEMYTKAECFSRSWINRNDLKNLPVRKLGRNRMILGKDLIAFLAER